MRARHLLQWISSTVVNHPKLLLIAVGLVVAASAALVPGIRVEAGHSALVDPDDIHQQRFQRFLHRFGSPYLLFALVEGGDAPLRRQVVDGLIDRLPQPGSSTRAEAASCSAGSERDNAPGCVRDVLGRLDLDALEAYGLLYLPTDKLRALVDALADEDVGLPRWGGAKDLGALFHALAEGIERRAERAPAAASTAPQGSSERAQRKSAQDGPSEQQAAEQAMALLAQLVSEIDRRVRDGASQAPPLGDQLREQLGRMVDDGQTFRGVDERGYLVSRDQKMHLAIVRPVNDSDDPELIVSFVDYVQQLSDRLAAEAREACGSPEACPEGRPRVTLTGLPALTAAEKKGLSRDLTFTTLVAIGGILVVFIFGFRSLPQGLLGLVPLVAALLMTLAFVRLTFGELNLLTSAFIPTVLGLGIDFAVHLLARYNETRREGMVPRVSIQTAIHGAGPGMLTGALTTAGAFCALIINDFKGFAELGLITAVGLLLSLAATLLIASPMLVLPSLRWLQRPPPEPTLGNAALMARYVESHHTVVIALSVVITTVMIWQGSGIPWSYNYLDLLPRGSSAVSAMTELTRRTDYSGEVAVLVAKDAAQAQQRIAALRDKATVGRIESLPNYIPSEQPDKLREIARLKPLLASLPAAASTASPSAEQAKIAGGVEALADTLEDLRFTAQRAGRAEAKALAAPVAALRTLHGRIEKGAPVATKARLADIQTQLLGGMGQFIAMLRKATTAGALDEATLHSLLPAGLRDRLFAEGHYAIYAYPKRSIWDPGVLRSFVAELREVDEAATGFPVTYWETNAAIERGFRTASILAALALIGLLFLDFRNVRYTVLALVPLGLGMAWMWGFFSLLGMSYNFANIIAFPLIIGIGVASGVHILHRYRQEGEREIGPVVRHTGLAILLSAVTTMVGFGSLALASHRGASSLGKVLLLGVGACLATSTMVLPALLHWVPQLRKRRFRRRAMRRS